MAKPTNKKELLNEILKERTKLEALLSDIPVRQKTKPVVDDMSIKDLLAHRAEWGAMMMHWYAEAKAGREPAVPHRDYKWNQLPDLNAAIKKRYARQSLKKTEKTFEQVHDELFALVKSMNERELFEKGVYGFTKSSNLAAYVNSSTAAHYRSAAKHIRKWWKTEKGA